MGDYLRQLLFSVKKEDFDWQYFRTGGPGGQKQNKTSSACRCIHRASRARGESRKERSQIQNKRIAFRHCIETIQFQNWLKVTVAVIDQGFRDVEKYVDSMMNEKNLKVEYFTPRKAPHGK